MEYPEETDVVEPGSMEGLEQTLRFRYQYMPEQASQSGEAVGYKQEKSRPGSVLQQTKVY